MRKRALTEGERDALAAALLAIPTTVLALANKGQKGSLRRAARNALVAGSMGAAGGGGLGFFDTNSQRDALDDTAAGSIYGGVVGGFIGGVATLAWKAFRK